MNQSLQSNAGFRAETASLREFVFYGASRVEAPRVGLKFRRTGTTFQVLGVRGERTRSREFARAWKFTAECQPIPLWTD